MSSLRSIVAACVAACALMPVAGAAAEPLRILSGGATVTVVRELARDFERTHGTPVVVTAGTAGQIRAMLAAGDPADIVILPVAGIDALAASGDLVAATRANLGRTGIGVGILAGSAAPDLSTVDAFKAALLAAPSIATTDPAAGASSGIAFAVVLQKLGIAEAIRAKETLVPGGFSCELVASGRASLCVQNISEIVPVHGVVVAAPLPPALQTYLTYAAAVTAKSNASDIARAFIADATSAARAPLWAQVGFEPVAP